MGIVSVDIIIKLLHLPRIGRRTARKILSFGNEKIRDDRDLMDLIEASSVKYRLPHYKKSEFEMAIRRSEEILMKSDGFNIKLTSVFDEIYPKLLKEISDPPLILNYKGNLSSVSENTCIAVVGTREPTSYGEERGERIGEIIAAEKMTVVSGLAKGCDTAGHLGALKTHGLTAAVMAHGLDTVYPKENRGMADDILASNGLLISEYFVGQKPIGNYFIERDRIQAGLSACVFVVETDIKGGTMHTVKYCLEYKRILACLQHPTELHEEPKVQGNRMLIAEGKGDAVYSASDIKELIKKVKKAFCVGEYKVGDCENTDKSNIVDLNTQLGLWD